MTRAAWFGAVWVSGALALAGCGSSSDGGAPSSTAGSANAGSAGTATAGGATANAGSGGSSASGGANTSGGAAGASTAGSASGGAGDLMLGNTNTEACVGYAIAACERNAECSGYDPRGCLFSGATCPDAVFSDGSTRTVAGLQACAQAYKTFPCAQLQKGKLPDCVTPGTRKQGEPCLYPSQCASLNCKTSDGSTCGVCASVAERGEACTSNLDCADLLACVGGVCAYGTSYVAAVGDACQTDADCPGLSCSSTTHSCAVGPTLGMACTTRCSDDSYCNASSFRCTARPLPGADCGFDAAYGNLQACAYGSICNPSEVAQTAKCAKVPGLGEPCLFEPDNPSQLATDCLGESYCDMDPVAPKCVATHSQGQPCTAGGSECQSGLLCACPDGTQSCAGPFECTAAHFTGQPCGAAGAACNFAFTCTNGACQPKDSSGRFTTACGAAN